MQATVKDDGHFEQILWRTLDILDVTFLFSEKTNKQIAVFSITKHTALNHSIFI